MTPKSKMIAFAMAGTVAAASAVVMRGPERMPHAHDLPVKVHMAELVIGATHGLTEIGWENPAIEARVAVLEEASEPHRDDALRETGREQALSGSWGDAIIEAYLVVLDTPAETLLAPTPYRQIREEFDAVREGEGTAKAAKAIYDRYGATGGYDVAAVTGRIKDVDRVWERVKAKAGPEATDAEVAALALDTLGYAGGPIAHTEVAPWMLETRSRPEAWLGHMGPRRTAPDVSAPAARMDLTEAPGTSI